MSDLTPEKSEQLRKPFPKSAVGKLPKGGVMLDYVGHAAVTDRLLQVDPKWKWEPFAIDERGLPALDSRGNLWIRLTVCGVTRVGVGDGKNAKEVIGDAIRNAAMRFGVALDLWSKEELEGAHGEEVHKATKPEAVPKQASQQQMAKLFALMAEAGITQRDAALAYVSDKIGRTVTTRNDLTPGDASKVIDALTRDIDPTAA